MADLDQLRAALGDIPVVTDPAKVQLKSRDFYWYSPVLKRQLERVCADLVVEPRDEAEVIRALGACHRQRVPVTVRGGGTGNYGQAMPLKGGVVLDLSRLDHIIEIDLGRVRAQAGAKLAQIDRACQEHSRQELRLHPSTLKMGTIGGFVAGGSSGVGSIGWGSCATAATSWRCAWSPWRRSRGCSSSRATPSSRSTMLTGPTV
jgi:FAD/FMN-containing dehydrogenase